MVILHYFLGFPPYRTGGLTKYACDLMEAQCSRNDIIIALWPGEIKDIGSCPIIKKREPIGAIKNFELINPLPVPIDEGIKNPKLFMSSCDYKVYKELMVPGTVNFLFIKFIKS